MTYCLGIKVRSGLVAIADTRLTSGNECFTGKKLFTHQRSGHSMFLMTSGLRSVRDKTLTYFKEILSKDDLEYTKMYQAVNAYAEVLRKVAHEDKKYLESSGLAFNLNTIIGGQFEDDDEHKLFLVYPEGNWVEVGEDSGSPFVIIGNSGYGKPLINRTLHYDSTLQFSLKIGFLSFDSTRVSANDVSFPIDVGVMKKDSYHIEEQRYDREEMQHISGIWQSYLTEAVKEIPNDWMQTLLNK